MSSGTAVTVAALNEPHVSAPRETAVSLVDSPPGSGKAAQPESPPAQNK